MRQESDYLNKPIRSMQTMLRTIGSNGDAATSVIPDGIYGSQTVRAVGNFQRAVGLPATGTADLRTWNRIVEEAERAHVRKGPAAPLQIVLQPDQIIQPGERNGHLYLIQALMAGLSAIYGNLPEVEITGVHDQQSQAAVKALKGCEGCGDDSTIDRPFYAMLVALYRAAMGDGT